MATQLSNSFTLDELRVPEDNLRPPVITPITVMTIRRECTESIELQETQQALSALISKNPLKLLPNQTFREGFIDIKEKEDSIEFFFVRETPLKLTVIPNEGTPQLRVERLKHIDPLTRPRS